MSFWLHFAFVHYCGLLVLFFLCSAWCQQPTWNFPLKPENFQYILSELTQWSTGIYSRYRNTGGADDTTYENGFFFFFERNCNLEKQKLNSQTPRFTFFILPVSQPAVSFSFQASCAPRDTNQRNMLYIQKDVMGYRCCCSSHQNVPSLLITTPSWMKQYRETICGKMLPWSLDGDNVYIICT